uniref:Transcription initiation factor TFIID subunit 8 n=1 Tax=Schistocephalus solidus TaxID=70667 RepID=A0A0X3P6T4_SCHSO
MAVPPGRTISQGDVPHGIIDVLEAAIAFSSIQCGFSLLEQQCLPILTNLYISFIESIGSKSLGYAESAGRTKIVLNDILLAFIDFGFDVGSLLEQPPIRQVIRPIKEPAPTGDLSQKSMTSKPVLGPNGVIIIPRTLRLRSEGFGAIVNRSSVLGSSSTGARVGTPAAAVVATPNKPPPKALSHLFLPPLPDPHTYLTTKVTRPPLASNAAALRRLALDQKREAQISLTKFLARIQPVHPLFPGDSESFPLLLPPVSGRPYLSALLADSLPESLEGNKASSASGNPPDLSSAPKSGGQTEGSLELSAGRTQRVEENFFLKRPLFPSAELDSAGFV